MLPLYSSIFPIVSPQREPNQSRLRAARIIQADLGTMTPGALLSFAGQGMKLSTATDAEETARIIEEFANMTVLELKGNTIGVQAGERLAVALQKHPELQRCLWSDMFTGRLKNEIPPVLRSFSSAMIQAGSHITELDLSDNAFGPIGAEGIQEFLVSPAAYSLEILRLNNNGLGAGGKIIARCLVDCYHNARRDGTEFRLKTFVAGRNRLENPGAFALADAFKLIGTLEHISIPQNGIRPEGIAALADALQENKGLKSLVLNDNTCSSKGAIRVAMALTNLVDLELLDLGDCLCRDAGVAAIIAQICDGEHHQLQTLDLSGSELTGIRAAKIIESWRQSYGRTNARLRITNNCFGSMFEDLEEQAKGLRVEFGELEDDEGSLSERESGSESDSGSDSDDEGEDSEVPQQKKTEHNYSRQTTTVVSDPAVDELLAGVGCLKMSASSTAVVMEPSRNGKLSFLDQQLKMDSAEDAEKVAQKIERTSNLKELELRGNTMGIEAGERVAEALKTHPELERCLWSDLFTGRLKHQIPPVLKSLCSAMMQAGCHITELDLSDNAFGPIGAEGIQEFLVSPAAYSLEVLKLNNNGLGAGGKVIARCLIECHAASVKAGRPLRLKTFIAGRNRLENPCAFALAEAFKKLGSLEELVMHQDGIRPEGIEALADSIEYNENLRIVNFQDNTATAKGSYALAMAIKKLKKLEFVNFGDCLCRDAGCHSIVDSLSPKVHTNLKELDLSGAELTGEAAMQISDKWKKFPNAKLIISANNFGSLFDDVLAIAEQANVECGDEEDDQGTLSDDEEEHRSDTSYDDTEEDDEEIIVDDAPDEAAVHAAKIEECRDAIVKAETEFSSRTQEESARLILKLALVIQGSGEDAAIVADALEVADDVVRRVAATRRRPIPTTTQMVNNVIAQLGFNVKPEVSWNLRPSKSSVLLLLNGLIARGHLAEERELVDFYFRQ